MRRSRSFVAVSPVFAQQRGSISGRVVDPGGLALPGATVTVTEQNTGFTRTVVTAETGAYPIPNLEPGTYTVTVEMPGFAALKQTDVAVTAGSAITLEFKMQVAGLQEEVIVTGQSPLVETTSNQIGGTPLEPRDRGRAVELPQLHRADAAHSRHDAQSRRVDRSRAGRSWPTARRRSRTST